MKIKASQHESYGTFTVLSILLPFVGFILGIVYLTKDSKLDKKLGEHCLTLSILFSIVGAIVYQFYFASNVNTLTTTPINTYTDSVATVQQTETNLKETIMLSNSTVKPTGGGYIQVLGEATNNGSNTVTMSLKSTFYDAQNKIVGTAIGSISDLAPRKTETFTLYSTSPITEYKSYKTQIDSIF